MKKCNIYFAFSDFTRFETSNLKESHVIKQVYYLQVIMCLPTFLIDLSRVLDIFT